MEESSGVAKRMNARQGISFLDQSSPDSHNGGNTKNIGVSVERANERIESIDLCSVHAPGIQTNADRTHVGCGDLEREPFLGQKRQLADELMIGGGKGVEECFFNILSCTPTSQGLIVGAGMCRSNRPTRV